MQRLRINHDPLEENKDFTLGIEIQSTSDVGRECSVLKTAAKD
jgi:hypothetical protein